MHHRSQIRCADLVLVEVDIYTTTVQSWTELLCSLQCGVECCLPFNDGFFVVIGSLQEMRNSKRDLNLGFGVVEEIDPVPIKLKLFNS